MRSDVQDVSGINGSDSWPDDTAVKLRVPGEVNDSLAVRLTPAIGGVTQVSLGRL
jgi:hypothetical protein